MVVDPIGFAITITITITIMVALNGVCFWLYRVEKLEKNKFKKELAKEKEKVRFLNLIHPDQIDEDGWSYYYDPSTYFVGRNHENGRGKQSICEIRRGYSPGGDTDYYGYRIANLLNEVSHHIIADDGYDKLIRKENGNNTK